MGLAEQAAGVTSAPFEASPELGREVLLSCLRDFPHVQLTVTGACMAPALHPGEVVRLVAPSRRRPRLGDVVLCAVPGGFRLHRLVWAPRGGRWRTKADNAPTWDGAASDSHVIATAVDVRSGARVRRTRSVARLLRSLIGVAAAHLRAAWRSQRPR